MAAVVVEPNWLELPSELMELILTKMASVDIIRLKAVCSSWYATANSYLSNPSSSDIDQQSPWLILPTGQDDRNTHLFNFAEQKHYKVKNIYQQLNDSSYYDPQCVGSSFGWLIIFDRRSNSCLLNPFSEAKIELPSAQNIGGGCCNWYGLRVFKAILLSDPSSSSRSTQSFTIVILHGGVLAFYRHGNNNNNTWTCFDNNPRFYCDILYHDGMLYAVEHRNEISTGFVEVWDFHSDFPQRISRIKHPMKLPRRARMYLAESLGDILCAIRYADEFHVYKLDYRAGRYERVESLKGQTLFLGGNKSISLRARDFPEWDQNSLYISFQLPIDMVYLRHDFRSDFGNVGVYNLQQKSLQPYIKFNMDYYTDCRPLAPIWIVPSI